MTRTRNWTLPVLVVGLSIFLLLQVGPTRAQVDGPTIVAVDVVGADTSDPSVATATSFDSSANDVSTVTFLPGVFDPSQPNPRFFVQVYQASNLSFAHTLHIVNVQWNADNSITVTVAIAEGGTFGNNVLRFSENYSIVGIQ